jgi:uncharacterized protein (TIGR02996 family)
MTHDEAFLADICERPDSDAPRLIYADWLDEHGGPDGAARAELIRLQCALARQPEEGPDRPRAQARCDALLAAHEAEWARPLDGLAEHCLFERGFVGEAEVTGEQLLRKGAELLRRAPLRRLTVRADSGQAGELAASPLLARVTRLEVRGRGLGDEGAAALAASPFLGGLRALVLHHCGVGPAGGRALAGAAFAGLERLNLGANDLDDEGVAALAAAPRLAGLRNLGLGANNLGRPAAAALAASPHLRRLEEVNLGANYLDDEAVRLLAASPASASLRVLDLRHNEFGDAGALALAASPYLGGLRSLDVTTNRFGAAGQAALRRRFGDRVRL